MMDKSISCKYVKVFYKYYVGLKWINGHHLMNHSGGYLPFEGIKKYYQILKVHVMFYTL